MKHRRQTGFTLVELIITLGLAGIVLGLGVPAFTDFIRNNRMIAVTNEGLYGPLQSVIPVPHENQLGRT